MAESLPIMPVPSPDDLARRLEHALSPRIREALQQAVACADELHVPCYLVGGPVRDLLLGRPIEDIDLVLEGDAIAVAERFATGTGGALTRHLAFRTANVALTTPGHTFHIDFVTARAEDYPEPAALPVVRPSGFTDDLQRRDFTINTLALRLSKPVPFTLIDKCGGLTDLAGETIRVLHDASFVDDPTRIVRAARFAARLGFVIEAHTSRLIARAAMAGLIEHTSSARMLNELWLTLAEPAPEAVFELLHELGALQHLLPGLEWTPELHMLLATARATPAGSEQRLVLLGLLAWSMPATARAALLRRYALPGDERRVVTEIDQLIAALETLTTPDLVPSEIYRLLRGLGGTTRSVGELVAPVVASAAFAQYRQTLHTTRPLLTGDDLLALQIAPGPRYRTLLEGLHAAQLDGQVRTRDEAAQWIRTQVTLLP